MVGNSFTLPVAEHLAMKGLLESGFITRNDVRQTGVIFAVNQDGPKRSWRAMVRAAMISVNSLYGGL